MNEELPDRLNMDKASSIFKNLSERTAYKKLQKALAESPPGRLFRGHVRPPLYERDRLEAERKAKERAAEVEKLRAEETLAERLARESDKAGDFKRFARFWNRMDAARQGLIRYGAAGP